MTPSIFVSVDQLLFQLGTLMHPQGSCSLCHHQLDPLLGHAAENSLEARMLVVHVPGIHKVFPCLPEQAAIQVLTDNTTTIFC